MKKTEHEIEDNEYSTRRERFEKNFRAMHDFFDSNQINTEMAISITQTFTAEMFMENGRFFSDYEEFILDKVRDSKELWQDWLNRKKKS